jgi:ABC-type transport system involved in multi-copper enzyme maturation permease subunit
MLRRMIVKEWKEKSSLVIFALAVFLLFSIAFSVYAKDAETLDLLVSTLLLVFPAAFALLLGASGFASEFQDGAWAYLFSRPVKRWRIWLAKCISLLTVLYVAILFLALLIRFHPVLATAGGTFHFTLVGDKSYGLFVFVMPLVFFMMSFSLSVVFDKPFSVAFLAALIWMALLLALTVMIEPLFNRGVLPSVLSAESIVAVLLPLSFILASFVTLNKADFSQPRSRAWTFTISAAASFLILAVAVSLYALGVWKPMDERYIYNLQSSADGVYFATHEGFFKFDAADGRTQKIARYRTMWGQISLGGDNVAFETDYREGARRGFAELRIMKINGQDEKSLVKAWDQDSPLYGGYFYPIRVSPRGDRVAFVARNIPKTTTADLWLVHSDGSNLRGYDLGTRNARSYLSLVFGNSGQSLFLFFSPKLDPGSNARQAGASIMRVDLESGEATLLAEGIRRPYLSFWQQARSESGADQIVYLSYDKGLSRDILTVLDSVSLVEQRIDLEDSVTCFRLNKAGDMLAFLTSRSKLGIYSLKDQGLVKIAEVKGYDLRWPSEALEWTYDNRLILTKIEGKNSSICLLDTDLAEQKGYRFPFTSNKAERIWSAGNYIIVEDTERNQLWGVDLENNKWLRIY